MNDQEIRSRARGCLLGQLTGDSLGSLVEFQTPEMIWKMYPEGIRNLKNGGTWNILAGQPTDDSEMALMLACMLIERERYDVDAALRAYTFWLQSGPFDCGNTIRTSLLGAPDTSSQANGALMRISPLEIFGAGFELEQVSRWAELDAYITHPHPVCCQINQLYTMAIAHAIQSGCSNEDLYDKIIQWAHQEDMEECIQEIVTMAEDNPPRDYMHHQGWVMTAFHNALWQLLHAVDVKTGIIDTVSCKEAIRIPTQPFAVPFSERCMAKKQSQFNGNRQCWIAAQRREKRALCIHVLDVFGLWMPYDWQINLCPYPS